MEDKHANTKSLGGDQIRISEDQIRSLFKSIPIPAYAWQLKGDDFILMDYNDAAKSFTGDKVAGLLRLKASELYRDEPQIVTEMQRCFQEQSLITREMDFNLKSSGARKYLNVKYVFVPPDLVIVLTEDLTERKLAEEQLSESEQKYRVLFESSSDAIMTLAPPSWKFIHANPAALRMFCITSGEKFASLRPWEMSPEMQPDGHPSAQKVLQMIEKAMRDGSCFFEWTHKRITGEEFPATVLLSRMELQGQPMLQATVCDITERKQAERQLRQSEENWKSYLESAPDGIYICDLKGTFQYGNKSAEEITGYTKEELLGKSFLELHLLRAKDLGTASKLLALSVMGKPTGPDELELVRNNGSHIFVEINTKPIKLGGKTRVIGFVRDITERKQNEKSLQESREQYRILIDNASEAILVAQDGYIKFANRTTFNIFPGYSESELTGKPFTDFVYSVDRTRIVDNFTKRLKGEPLPISHEYRLIMHDGIIKWVEIGTALIEWKGQPATLNFITDITERKFAEQKIAHLGSFPELNPGPVIELYQDGSISYANPVSIRLFPDLKSLGTRHPYLVDWQNIVSQLMASRTKTLNREVRVGDSHYIQTIQYLESLNAFRIYGSDITERKKAEVENSQLREKAEITSRLAAVGEMAAGIAHEINNPLTGVIGFSELLMEKKGLPDDIKEEIKIINDGSHRVKDIVKRMLTFARQSKPMKASTNINELIEATLGLRSYVLRTANIEVIKHLAPDLPGAVVDPGQMQQVFLNLIVNAEYSMKKAHGRGIMTITTQKKDDHIIISIKDDGLGIRQEDKGKLFNPFFTTKEVGEGTGLGLSLSHAIILEHGGTIEVESQPGQGAIFIITLPITPLSEEVPLESVFAMASPQKVKGALILVVDDEDAIRKLISMLLSQRGHIVDTTGDAREALIKMDSSSYDVVLMDIRMPDMSGIELYNNIKMKRPELAGRFIFITGDTTDENTKSFLEKNELSYISKPFDRETLTQKVNDIL